MGGGDGNASHALWADTLNGVDYLECDPHLIRDGAVVIILSTNWPCLAKALVKARG